MQASHHAQQQPPPPVAARQAEVARDYLKRAAGIGELNGRPPGSDGPMASALKRYNGGRVLVFVLGAFAEMSEDVSRICGIIAHDPCCVCFMTLALPSIRSRTKGASDTIRTKAREANSACLDGAGAG